jgi:hypothetical protein
MKAAVVVYSPTVIVAVIFVTASSLKMIVLFELVTLKYPFERQTLDLLIRAKAFVEGKAVCSELSYKLA